MTKRSTAVVEIAVIRCGCGHVVTAMDRERAKSAMLDHLVFSHAEAL